MSDSKSFCWLTIQPLDPNWSIAQWAPRNLIGLPLYFEQQGTGFIWSMSSPRGNLRVHNIHSPQWWKQCQAIVEVSFLRVNTGTSYAPFQLRSITFGSTPGVPTLAPAHYALRACIKLWALRYPKPLTHINWYPNISMADNPRDHTNASNLSHLHRGSHANEKRVRTPLAEEIVSLTARQRRSAPARHLTISLDT